MRTFTAVFKKTDNWWVGYVKEIPGVNTQGKTLEEARENLKEALKLVLEVQEEFLNKDLQTGDVICEELAI